ncbi:hypothetical protein [Chryseobacterium sp. Bi04]|uniref:hypothetical protein n=1 Tax=Chryseobacterium sp. Bi04 TaxID=2822345 RepID=UPI001E2E52AE|nr:hypothetical protein [Chryseobacterium sp. Bi04]
MMMKSIYFSVACILLFSCSKTVEDRCFISLTDQIFEGYKEQKSYTVKQILDEKPDYLEIVNLTKYRDFKKDSTELHAYTNSDEEEKKWKAQEEEFKIFHEKFSMQFWYCSQQKIGNILYGLARNNLGYWLLKIENDKPSAYFMGLSFSHYYFNVVQKQPIIDGDYLQVEGSLVKIIKVPGLPGYDDYSAMEDGKLFKIKLKYLLQDSDKDGYNDIFEKSFGLNPNNADTDRDGINDFADTNPLFKSEKNKFTQLYELMLPNYGDVKLEQMYYSFAVYKNDCDYFHQINPNQRVLFVPENRRKQTAYTRITDVFQGSISKIKKDVKNPNKFYIYVSGSSFTNDYAAEYQKGKWVIRNIGGISI